MTGLVRFNPLEEFASLWPRDWFSRPSAGTPLTEWSPRCDVTEKDGEILVHAELPGVEAKDMEVKVQNRVLTIRGEKRVERTEDEKERHYSERFFGSFERSLTIPENVDEERIEASLKDGVLEVHLPKLAVARPEARKIEIRST
ncbi:MAG: Hsp20/alpha crystallin family protein [Dehalococcoidia bacterium]|nr:Hsp20/alpha crystallin family protein [Dehalococcoidia bacterium]